MLGLDSFPLLKLRQVYQYVNLSEAKIYNIAEFGGLPFLEGIYGVNAVFEPVSPTRVNVEFQRYFLGLQRLINYHSPERFIQDLENQKIVLLDFKSNNSRRKYTPWLDVTYLDGDLRISRGNEGNLFILSKEKS